MSDDSLSATFEGETSTVEVGLVGEIAVVFQSYPAGSG